MQKHARGDRQPENADERLELREQREHPSYDVQLVAPAIVSCDGKGRVHDEEREDEQPRGNVDRQEVLLHLHAGTRKGGYDETRIYVGPTEDAPPVCRGTEGGDKTRIYVSYDGLISGSSLHLHAQTREGGDETRLGISTGASSLGFISTRSVDFDTGV